MKIKVRVYDSPTVRKEVDIRTDTFQNFKEDFNKAHEADFEDDWLYKIFLTLPTEYLLN